MLEERAPLVLLRELVAPEPLDRPPARTIPVTSLPSPAVAFPSALHVREPETALDAEMPARHRMVLRRGHLHDLVVLDMHLELTSHPAIGADRVR